MPGSFSPPLKVSGPDIWNSTCITQMPWCMLGSLMSSFPLKAVVVKTFPAFPAYAQPAILCIWYEAHGTHCQCYSHHSIWQFSVSLYNPGPPNLGDVWHGLQPLTPLLVDQLVGLTSCQNRPMIWIRSPDSKIHGANMGSIWGRQNPGEPHVGPMNFAIWESL